jgi:hypothetical protein
VAASRNSSRAPLGPRSRNRPSRKIRLRSANSHFDAFALPFRLFERWRAGQSAGDISRALIYASRNLASPIRKAAREMLSKILIGTCPYVFRLRDLVPAGATHQAALALTRRPIKSS